MDNHRKSTGAVIVLGILLLAANGIAGEYNFSSVGVGGYDVVAYHTQGDAVRGTGFHAAEHEGVTYLFTTKKNRDKFIASPGDYLPEFGGFCAFGA